VTYRYTETNINIGKQLQVKYNSICICTTVIHGLNFLPVLPFIETALCKPLIRSSCCTPTHSFMLSRCTSVFASRHTIWSIADEFTDWFNRSRPTCVWKSLEYEILV